MLWTANPGDPLHPAVRIFCLVWEQAVPEAEA